MFHFLDSISLELLTPLSFFSLTNLIFWWLLCNNNVLIKTVFIDVQLSASDVLINKDKQTH